MIVFRKEVFSEEIMSKSIDMLLIYNPPQNALRPFSDID